MNQTISENQLEATINNDLSLDGATAQNVIGGLQQQDPKEPERPNSGGPLPPVTLRPGGYGCGGILLNHNETTVEDDASELNDLTVNEDAEIVGGPLKRIRIGGMSFGEEGVE